MSRSFPSFDPWQKLHKQAQHPILLASNAKHGIGLLPLNKVSGWNAMLSLRSTLQLMTPSMSNFVLENQHQARQPRCIASEANYLAILFTLTVILMAQSLRQFDPK
jgi:hypothetical protein